jgi:hypothetical protein
MAEYFLIPLELLMNNNIDSNNAVSITILETALLENLAGFYYGMFFTNPERLTNSELMRKAEYYRLPVEELEVHAQPYYYNNFRSGRIIIDFVMEHPPFNSVFTDERTARDFYENLRSGLVHDAMPKNGWKLKLNENPDDEMFLELKEKMDGSYYYVFYYNTFFNAIKNSIELYSNALADRFNEDLKKRFIQKIDEVCHIKKVWFFAYGSHMYGKIIKRRIENVHEHRTCVLRHFTFRIDKKCEDGTVKANISHNPGTEVWGVCYLLDYSDFKIIAEQFERGYKYFDVAVHDIDGNLIIAKTFLSSFINNTVKPNSDYLNCVINGAYEKGLPLEYVWNIMDNYQ